MILLIYRVSQVVIDLGWLGFDLDVPRMTAELRCTILAALSPRQNQGSRLRS